MRNFRFAEHGVPRLKTKNRGGDYEPSRICALSLRSSIDRKTPITRRERAHWHQSNSNPSQTFELLRNRRTAVKSRTLHHSGRSEHMRFVHLCTPTRSRTFRLRRVGLASRPPSLPLGMAPSRAQDGGPAVVPYRPSVATPAQLPAPGWPELEAGGAWAKGGDTARSFSSPVTFKLAWSDSWAIDGRFY